MGGFLVTDFGGWGIGDWGLDFWVYKIRMMQWNKVGWDGWVEFFYFVKTTLVD